MGETKETTTVNTTQQAKPTGSERKLNRLALQRAQATQSGMIQAQRSSLGLINQLLSGSTDLPGFFGQMGQGISPEAIGAQSVNLAQQALPQFQSMGLTDSGVMGREIARAIANELLFPAEQFNLGAKQNLLNMAFGGQAQVQQPILGSESTLGARLAGLRSLTGSQTSTASSNPFLSSFYSSLGQTLGSPSFKMGPLTF